ncbi:hypothetical protein HDV57DRAFT_390273 [Trichoderma longibrachiatum]
MRYLLKALLGLYAATSLVVADSDHADGISPFGDGFGPDVTVDPSWNDTAPSFEGVLAPDLDGEGVATANDTEPDIGTLYRRAAKDFYLRVMPLGASITQGQASTDGNGYRKWLREQLRWKGWKVNMVGSKMDGNMADRDNEGWPGWIITQVQGAFDASKWMMPNLVLLNVGTNDCGGNVDTGNAGGRLKTLIDDIFQSIPGVTVIVSTLAPSRDYNACASSVSEQYRNLVKQYSGARVGLADINSAMPMSLLSGDGTHPNDDGYKLFAAVWWDAIRKLEDQIQPPASVSLIDDNAVGSTKTCAKVAGTARGPIQSQQGSGHDDGNYVHNRVEKGALKSARIDKFDDPKNITDNIPWHMFFANLVVGDPNAARSAALDDWIRVYHDTRTNNNTYYFRQNLGGGNFGPSTTFDVDQNCDGGPLYAFADFNNDGLDDFYCLKSGSAVAVSINKGGNPPKFESLGQVVGTHDGYTEKDVRIGDVDGDGRADYCLTQPDATLICSRNGGTDDKYQWQGFSTATGLRGMVFNGKKGDPAGVVLGDLNGDFRSDYLYVGDNGNVETWINSRGWGKGIVPSWRSAGLTHPGQADTGIRGQIKFGRIYGSGRLDYIYLDEDDTGYDVKVWQNTGSGGTRRKADGNYYCDMRGTGADDYVWIYSDGHAAEINANIHNLPLWGHSTTISLSVPGPRVGIHLADWTGDGKCDVLVQNKATGALTLYENQYNAGKNSLTFANRGVVTGAVCSQGWGVGIFDLGMRLADIDGDKRADVLCLEKNGRVTAWLNTASGLIDVGQVKYSEGWDRANMRFADVEGSGRADLIHLDKYTGAGTVFKNNGPGAGGGGSSFSWKNRGVLYAPIDRGETMHFTNQGGLGRADLLHVLPLTNRAWTYFNECGGSGGDDTSVADPGLPAYGDGDGGSTPPGGGNGGPVSTDGNCGAAAGGAVCTGSAFGSCCNGKSKCGNTAADCGIGCQPLMGLCSGQDHQVDNICTLKFQNDDASPMTPDELEATWKNSGAEKWFRSFLDDHGAENWSSKFFKAATAGGIQGGSTYDCTHMNSGNCPGPLGTACVTYNPPSAFFVHIQMGNLYSAYERLWFNMITDGITELSSGIKDIVSKWGTPPKEDNEAIIDMLVGILKSILGGVSEKDAALSGPLGFFGEVMDEITKVDPPDPSELEDELDIAYGSWFTGVMHGFNDSSNRVFSGAKPDDYDGSAEDWVWTRFQHGQWLDSDVVGKVVDEYSKSVQNKFKEYAAVTAMKTGNSGFDYFLIASSVGSFSLCFQT